MSSLRKTVLLNLLSVMVLLGISGWIVLEPYRLRVSLEADVSGFLSVYLDQHPVPEERDEITRLLQFNFLLGSLSLEVFAFSQVALLIWFPLVLISLRILYQTFPKTPMFLKLSSSLSKTNILMWFFLPYALHLIDLMTAFIGSRVLLLFTLYESNPSVIALLRGFPHFYLSNLAFASLLMTPLIILVFTAEANAKVNSKMRKLLILLLASPFMLGIATNLLTILNGI